MGFIASLFQRQAQRGSSADERRGRAWEAGDAAAGVGLLCEEGCSSPAWEASPLVKHSILPTVLYRPCQPEDEASLQQLHEELFPIRYEAEFFSSVVHGRGILSWAAVASERGESERLIGFITVRLIRASEAEDSNLLGYEAASGERSLVYILTLGVSKPFRNAGIASALVERVVRYAERQVGCRGVYLHVIAYNRSAICFYAKQRFLCLRRMSNFYLIDSRTHDAFLYMHYVNGGRAPCSPLDALVLTVGLVRRFFYGAADYLVSWHTPKGKSSSWHSLFRKAVFKAGARTGLPK